MGQAPHVQREEKAQHEKTCRVEACRNKRQEDLQQFLGRQRNAANRHNGDDAQQKGKGDACGDQDKIAAGFARQEHPLAQFAAIIARILGVISTTI